MHRVFISDLHLDGEDKRYDALIALFESLPAGSELYLLGDIFEAWVGDAPWLSRLAQRFNELANRDIHVFFMHGNRDFLLGQAWAQAASITILRAPHCIHHENGDIWTLCHGDELCTDDEAYQAFRALSRSDAWITDLLAKPLEERKAIAQQLRLQSQNSNANKSDNIMDVNAEAVEQLRATTNAAVVIHGHTHRPAIHQSSDFQRVVLGDWTDHYYLVIADDHELQLERRDI